MCINFGNRISKYYYYMIILILESRLNSYKYLLSTGNSRLISRKPLHSKNLI